MNKFWARLVAAWQAMPPKTQQWLKGAEVAVATAIVSSFLAAPASDFTTKKGIAEFVAGVAAAAYAALRLYLTQSPVPVLVARATNTQTFAVGDMSKTLSTSTMVTSGGLPFGGEDGTIDGRGNFIPDSKPCVNCGADPLAGKMATNDQPKQQGE